MRIAIPYTNGKIALQFAGAKTFKFYQIEDQLLLRSYVIASGVEDLEETAKFLRMAGVHMVICGGIGGAAVKALDAQSIMIMGGILGDADQRIEEFIKGELEFRPLDPKAPHTHDHGGCHHEGHECDQNCQDCTSECTDCKSHEEEAKH